MARDRDGTSHHGCIHTVEELGSETHDDRGTDRCATRWHRAGDIPTLADHGLDGALRDKLRFRTIAKASPSFAGDAPRQREYFLSAFGSCGRSSVTASPRAAALPKALRVPRRTGTSSRPGASERKTSASSLSDRRADRRG